MDGLHVGHQRVLARTREAASRLGGKSALISLYPHPAEVLGRAARMARITSLRQSVKLLSEIGIDFLYLIHFTSELSRVPAREFIRRVLIDAIDVRHLVVGEDAAVGHGREGNVAVLRAEMEAQGRTLEVLPFLELNGEKVGSRAVRRAVEGGDLELARKLLGRRFAVEGRVRRGDGRGTRIGIPTANLRVSDQVLPKWGVYAATVSLGQTLYNAVTNIGIRPTFGGTEPVVESHFLDCGSGRFYGKRIEVTLHTRLRDEMRFGSVTELKRQIALDIAQARRILVGVHAA